MTVAKTADGQDYWTVHNLGYSRGYEAASREVPAGLADECYDKGMTETLREIEPAFDVVRRFHDDNHAGVYRFCREDLCAGIQRVEDLFQWPVGAPA